jgi:hypothetical protein
MEPLQTTADASALSARVAALLDANRPAAARHLLAAVRRLMPPSPDVAELAARLAVSEGNPAGALECPSGDFASHLSRLPADGPSA